MYRTALARYRLKEAPMNNLDSYPWRKAYVSAILETDKVKLIGRIAEARQAIDDRLFSPIDLNSPEHLAIKDASKRLATLKAQRLDRSI
jgi:hypothetical protein